MDRVCVENAESDDVIAGDIRGPAAVVPVAVRIAIVERRKERLGEDEGVVAAGGLAGLK